MKKFLYILMLLPFGAFAQYASDANVIFSGNSDLKGFGAYEMKLTQISDATSLFLVLQAVSPLIMCLCLELLATVWLHLRK